MDIFSVACMFFGGGYIFGLYVSFHRLRISSLLNCTWQDVCVSFFAVY